VLMALATIWTAVAWWCRQRRSGSLPDPLKVAAALGVLALVVTVRTAVDATDAQQSDVQLSLVLEDLVGPTVAGLERGDGASTGRDGRYLVSWTDALHIGSQAYGLMSELERAGFDAGLLPVFHVPATGHRVVEPEEATARVELVTGAFVDEWREREGAVELAHVDPRTPADVARFDELRRQVLDDLRAADLDELTEVVDINLFGAAVDPRVPDVTRRLMDEMLHLGLPTSVFVAPPDTP
jgi:hypothetical protein